MQYDAPIISYYPITFFRKIQNKIMGKADPYYNPHLSLVREDFSL
jgi:hypothetical protein